MLSQRPCTNQTGNHRRQRSTPTISTTISPRPLNRAQQHRQLLGDRFTSSHPNDVIRDGERGLQHEQHHGKLNNMQETQYHRSRPGSISAAQYASWQPSDNDQIKQESKQQNTILDFTSLDSLLCDSDQITNLSEQSVWQDVSQQSAPDFFVGQEHTFEGGDSPELYLSSTSENPTQASQETHVFRPTTPENNTTMGQYPMTPATTPYSRHNTKGHAVAAADTVLPMSDINSYQFQPELMQRGRSFQDHLTSVKQQIASSDTLSSPKQILLQRRSVDYTSPTAGNFLNMAELRSEMPNGHGGYDPKVYSPLTDAMSSSAKALDSIPGTSNMTLFKENENDGRVLGANFTYGHSTKGLSVMTEVHHHDQFASQNFQSPSQLGLEQCVEDTGITQEEVASFIQGPLPEDQKWRCLFQDVGHAACGKKFARKENARSHVQTHLGDRQFVCKVCHTKFVRMHDLKRHFKIHTAEKTHKCPCGKDFHRHDALTRHRQRGMCIGAFDNLPRKVAKRGRPPKTRPQPEERQEKAAKTRQHVLSRIKPGSTYASSISGCSEQSHASPPALDDVSIGIASPSLSQRAIQDHTFRDQGHLDCSILTPPSSPNPSDSSRAPESQGSLTPHTSQTSFVSPQFTGLSKIVEVPGEQQESLGLGAHDFNHSSPPELDLSDTSPATSNFYDFIGSGTGDALDSGFLSDKLGLRTLQGDFSLFEVNAGKGISAACDDLTGNTLFENYLKMSNTHGDETLLASTDQSDGHDPVVGIPAAFMGPSLRDLDDIFDGL